MSYQLLHTSANSQQMYLNALLKMLSCSGLYSMSYWYIDNATTALKYPVQVFSPAVITHPILAHHMTTHSQNHFYGDTLSPTLTVYHVSCETLRTLYTELTSCLFSNSGLCHYHGYTLKTHTFLNHTALFTVPFLMTSLTHRYNIQMFFSS